MLTKNDAQLKSREPSFIWGKMRAAAQEAGLRESAPKRQWGKANTQGFGQGGPGRSPCAGLRPADRGTRHGAGPARAALSLLLRGSVRGRS